MMNNVRTAHRPAPVAPAGTLVRYGREAREAAEDAVLAPWATRARGAGLRHTAEEADPVRTCFERDRDRILHSTAFRRLGGKTQVLSPVLADDHTRTRATHSLEVAQVAVGIASQVGLNLGLTEAAALGHDCGHSPFGHAGEDALAPYFADGWDHAVHGADVTLAPLNLTLQTLDAVRNHSWRRPAPSTPEAEVVAWADRAYLAHDFQDAVGQGIVNRDDLPGDVVAVFGRSTREQVATFIEAIVTTILDQGVVGMDAVHGDALAVWRAWNFEHIYTRPEAGLVHAEMQAVVTTVMDRVIADPALLPDPRGIAPDSAAATVAACEWVASMTDRYVLDLHHRLTGTTSKLLTTSR